MRCCSLLKPLIVGTLVWIAWSGAHAQPPRFLFESGRVTFSSASAADAATRQAFGFSSGMSTAEDDEDHDGSSHATSPWGKHSNGLRLGASDKIKPHGKHDGLGAPPVSAIPEPPTLALLVAGLVGVAFMARRRRPSRR